MTRKRKDLPAGNTLSLDQFLAASHVQVRSIEHSHHALDDALRAQGVGRNIALALPHFVAVPGVLAVTDLFATLPRTARAYPQSRRRVSHLCAAGSSCRKPP